MDRVEHGFDFMVVQDEPKWWFKTNLTCRLSKANEPLAAALNAIPRAALV
jgi:hypothetical protein